MLCETDVRAIVRLLGRVSMAGGDLAHKRQHLLIELCELIDADAWTWSLGRRPDRKRATVCLDRATGGRRATPAAAAPALPAGHVHDLVLDSPSGARVQLTVSQISDDIVSSITLARQPDRPPFAPREAKIAKIILSEIPWLHEKHSTIQAKRIGAALSPGNAPRSSTSSTA